MNSKFVYWVIAVALTLPIFNELVKEYPQDWYAWAGQGDCFLQLNDLSQAERSFHRAAELSHEPRATQEWEQIRARMSGSSLAH
jgi:hypothetical protein